MAHIRSLAHCAAAAHERLQSLRVYSPKSEPTTTESTETAIALEVAIDAALLVPDADDGDELLKLVPVLSRSGALTVPTLTVLGVFFAAFDFLPLHTGCEPVPLRHSRTLTAHSGTP